MERSYIQFEGIFLLDDDSVQYFDANDPILRNSKEKAKKKLSFPLFATESVDKLKRPINTATHNICHVSSTRNSSKNRVKERASNASQYIEREVCDTS